MSEKKVVSVRLAEEQVEYLKNTARRLGRTPSQVAAMLVDEGLRRERFPQIEMRDSLWGRSAYVRGTRWPVHLIVVLVRGGDTLEEIAADRSAPLAGLRAALDYAEAFPEEMEFEATMEEEFGRNPERFIPGVQIFRPHASPS